jgi:hypothetical protein
LDNERKQRYEWEDDDAFDVVEEGKGEALDLTKPAKVDQDKAQPK